MADRSHGAMGARRMVAALLVVALVAAQASLGCFGLQRAYAADEVSSAAPVSDGDALGLVAAEVSEPVLSDSAEPAVSEPSGLSASGFDNPASSSYSLDRSSDSSIGSESGTESGSESAEGSDVILPSNPAYGVPETTTRLFFFTFGGGRSTDAILIESNGRFGMIDAGEDWDYPDGSDPAYPLRDGITVGFGIDDQVIAAMHEIGVTQDNFDFFIGTHPHSDHIGAADEVIREFRPKTVYTPEYQDSYISSEDRLWDNQYCYDNLIAAAIEVGAVLVTSLDASASNPEATECGSVGSPYLTLGDAQIEIFNYDQEYRYDGAVMDANWFSWGVKITAFGRSAVVMGDINNYDGDEDRLGAYLGHVDLLKLGHHGLFGSNSPEFLRALVPTTVVQTGEFARINATTLDCLNEMGSKYFDCGSAYRQGLWAIQANFTAEGIWLNTDTDALTWRPRSGDVGITAFRHGRMVGQSQGWKKIGGYWYWFDQDSPSASCSCWRKSGGYWYYLAETGRMATGWVKDGSTWYYMDSSGRMQANRWLKLGTSWYCLGASGAMATGWARVSGEWYWLDAETGRMATGWLEVPDGTYYLSSSGAMCTGWVKIGNTSYYFDGKGRLVTSDWVGPYYVDERGAWSPNYRESVYDR